MTEADKALDQIALIVHKSKKPDQDSWGRIGEILKGYYAEQKRAAAREESKRAAQEPAPATHAPAPSSDPTSQMVVDFGKVVNTTRAEGLQQGRNALESMISDTAAVIRQHGQELVRVTAIKYGKV